jgi:hypothetical protein
MVRGGAPCGAAVDSSWVRFAQGEWNHEGTRARRKCEMLEGGFLGYFGV